MDLTPELASIRAPTLVTTGSHDVATPKEMGAAIATAIPGARCVELPIAHLPPPEESGLYAHTILEFLRGESLSTERDRYDTGLARRREVLGAAHVDSR
jgi:3-oxoadipate enol-lactonase/4-carboxymuconolactone decarboxylase